MTLLTTIAVGFAVAVVALMAYVTVRSQSIGTLDDSLRERATAAARTNALDMVTHSAVPPWAFGAGNVRIAFLFADGFQLNAGGPLPRLRPELAVARGHQDSLARTVTVGQDRFRVVAVPAGSGQALVLAQSLEPTDRMLRRLGLVTLLFGLAGVIAAGLAGWAVARNGLRPVRRLTVAVEDIARTERLDPIPVEGNDEVARLSLAFNAMLAALSSSRRRQRQLVADAGHELRTPLTSLRTNLDLLVQADARLSPEARSELLADVRAQTEEMTTLIGDLVELARDEPMTPTVEPVDLAEVVEHAVARVRLRAPLVHFDVQSRPWWLVGEPASLERAITNLLDNAAKWSPEGGTVSVRLDEGTMSVADEGPGIAEHDLPHVFDRFYRSTESRAMPGSGLGLSIVRAVVERHGGQVSATNAPDGGAVLWLRLPGSSTPPPSPA
ncbi:MAG TPA: HAMP domain-containing sensor histidine kinase [Marmoricola sp.]|nr:HAMP domain-containing sensor histidine kinase [Marmoricola sp.]